MEQPLTLLCSEHAKHIAEHKSDGCRSAHERRQEQSRHVGGAASQQMCTMKEIGLSRAIGADCNAQEGQHKLVHGTAQQGMLCNLSMSCLTNGIDLWTEGFCNGLVLVCLEAFNDHLPATHICLSNSNSRNDEDMRVSRPTCLMYMAALSVEAVKAEVWPTHCSCLLASRIVPHRQLKLLQDPIWQPELDQH